MIPFGLLQELLSKIYTYQSSMGTDKKIVHDQKIIYVAGSYFENFAVPVSSYKINPLKCPAFYRFYGQYRWFFVLIEIEKRHCCLLLESCPLRNNSFTIAHRTRLCIWIEPSYGLNHLISHYIVFSGQAFRFFLIWKWYLSDFLNKQTFAAT